MGLLLPYVPGSCYSRLSDVGQAHVCCPTHQGGCASWEEWLDGVRQIVSSAGGHRPKSAVECHSPWIPGHDNLGVAAIWGWHLLCDMPGVRPCGLTVCYGPAATANVEEWRYITGVVTEFCPVRDNKSQGEDL